MKHKRLALAMIATLIAVATLCLFAACNDAVQTEIGGAELLAPQSKRFSDDVARA